MLWYTIINVVVGVVAVFAVLGIYRKEKKLQEELIEQQNDIGICDNCEHLKIKCAPGDTYEGRRYICKFYRFDHQPSACGDYKPKDSPSIVYCKDCRFLIDRNNGTHGCYRGIIDDCELDNYCSYGERSGKNA